MATRALVGGLSALVALCLPAAAGAQQTAAARSDSLAEGDAAVRRLAALLGAAEEQVRATSVRVAPTAEGARQGVRATLVVLLRADSGAGRALGAAALSVNGAPSQPRVYYAQDREALSAGAADELFRAHVLAVAHSLAVQVTVGGRALAQTVRVEPARGAELTYVEFAVRGGQLVASSWSAGAPGAGQ